MVFIAGLDSELHSLGKASVDHHVSARRKRRTGAGQKRHGIGEFIIGTHSPHRDTGDGRVVKRRELGARDLARAAPRNMRLRVSFTAS